jgi:hypothetical protein
MHINIEDEIGAELASSNTKTIANQRIFNPKVLVKGVEKSKARTKRF